MEQKRLALAFVMVAVLLIVWQVFFPPVVPQPPRPRADSTAAATAGAPPAAAPAAVPRAPAARPAPGPPPAPAPAAVPGARAAPPPTAGPPARAVTVRSPLYQYTFSTR